ncbi:MAG: monofunctional biosynthetic peptidoglycan transglycosylase [Deltaproteobacteria bacterium]|nr:monofunctional biosynthetic peptidoglycan transglycosylase [Deltaproteobacteria bacterium]MDQ3295502.1 monofunctional biosynthetic peptidoglycan transglycosylase [Myxococcota bacterium]
MARKPARPRRWVRIAARVVEVTIVLLAIGALLLWCSVPDTRPLATGNPASTAFIDLRRAQAADAGKPFELAWTWKPIGKISRYLRASIIYAEDYNFYRHEGIDWQAIEHAVEANWDKGSLSIGGSTITQQLAKNLYLSPSRSFLRKLREMLIAYSLEDNLSKQRILELYLNVVEWGDGVFGAEAAARHWFKKPAIALTPAEAIRLAIALPNPFTRAPDVRSPALTRKAVRLAHLLRMQGLIDEVQERATLDALGAPNEKVLRTRRPRGAPVTPTTSLPTTMAPAPPPPSSASEPDQPEADQPILSPSEAPADPGPEPPRF